METKFLQNSIKQNGKSFKVWYSASSDESITVYEDGYANFRYLKGFAVIDNTDSQVDYFEKGRFTLKKGDRYFEEAKKAMEAKRNSSMNRRAKAKLNKAQKLEQIPEDEKIIISGKWYQIISEKAHPRLEGFTSYILESVFGRKGQHYLYAKSQDGKKYIPLTKVWSEKSMKLIS